MKKLAKTSVYGAVCPRCAKKFNPVEHIAWGKLAPGVAEVTVLLPRGFFRFFRYDHTPRPAREQTALQAIARSAQQRHGRGCAISSQYLQGLWEAQGGRCAISGLLMDAQPRRRGGGRGLDPWRASLDRIEPARGYVRGNVRLVCYITNVAKNAFTDEQLEAFCLAVAARVQARSAANGAAVLGDGPSPGDDLPPLDLLPLGDLPPIDLPPRLAIQ